MMTTLMRKQLSLLWRVSIVWKKLILRMVCAEAVKNDQRKRTWSPEVDILSHRMHTNDPYMLDPLSSQILESS